MVGQRGTIAVLGGVAAGAVGTVAMDLVWFRRARAEGSDESFAEWELSTDLKSFDDAGAPAQVGQKAARAIHADIPARAAGVTTDVVHWLTGSSWAVGGSLLAAYTGAPPFVAGLAAGVAAFTGAYTILPALGIYDPIWEYDGKTIWKDASAHATFAVATGAALTAIAAVARRTYD